MSLLDTNDGGAAGAPPQVRAADAAYFRRCLALLPAAYTELDNSRMSAVFFGLSGLEAIGALDREVSPAQAARWRDWILAQQIAGPPPPPSSEQQSEQQQQQPRPLPCARYGFRGGSLTGVAFDPAGSNEIVPYDSGHLTMTYTALASLIILGDDLSRVDRAAISESMSFVSCEHSGESDLRFLYSACAIAYILNDWSGVDKAKAVEFILACE
ncbi:Geranylgeranyl transferase type-1 subunit beta, partial [Cladochytrium tenue]